MRFLVLLLLLAAIYDPAICRAEAPEEARLATGLGIAAPNVSSLVNVNDGFTSENPAGVMFQNGPRISLQLTRSNDTDDMGYEAGYSGDSFGAAVGMYSPACSGCFSRLDGILGATIAKSTMVGVRYSLSNSIPTYGAGAILNANGNHRFGLTLNYENPPTPNTQVTSFAGGYAYVEKKQTIAVEFAKQQNAAAADTTNSIILASIGYQRRVDNLQASVSYQRRMNDPSTSNEAFWLGAGFNGQTWHLALYSQYNLTFMAVISGFF